MLRVKAEAVRLPVAPRAPEERAGGSVAPGRRGPPGTGAVRRPQATRGCSLADGEGRKPPLVAAALRRGLLVKPSAALARVTLWALLSSALLARPLFVR